MVVCNAFIEKKYKKRHERKHQQESDAAIKVDPVPASMIGMHYQESTGSEGFVSEILTKFRTDEIGKVCVKDPSLLKIGRMWWYKLRSRKDKKLK